MTTSEMRAQFPELYAQLFGSLNISRLEAACARNSRKTDQVLRGIDAVKLLAKSLVQVRQDGNRKR
jgi:hypothetical protein